MESQKNNKQVPLEYTMYVLKTDLIEAVESIYC